MTSKENSPIVVCKIGGSVIEGVDPSMIEDVKSLHAQGYRLVFVHGGGDQVTSIAEKLGKQQRFITSPDGIKSRYTDKETAEIFTMVMSGLLAKQIAQTLQKNGINAISLTGIDAGLLRAQRKKRLVVLDDRGRKIAIEGGYTGKISLVNTALLESLLSASLVPIISPVAAGEEEWELLNVDGDRACSHVAGALKADAAIFLTDTEGLILNGNVVTRLSVKEARAALPSIGSGMDKKVIAAAEAIEMGTKRSVIASGLKGNPLQSAITGRGTVIVA
ncbi:MAG TPA: [LysW]-aminoadipate/[LysW]-glutamate kinase [Nitrososphaerales archaeon]|nr:[LysW]-aminoadipate/[LysW]-glutamate kinase [Nitrososphaerales archaeon]